MIATRTQASDSPDGINSIILLFIILIATIVVFSLVGYLFSSIARHGHLFKNRQGAFKTAAVLCACATLCTYVWGALHIIFMEDPGMRTACLKAGGKDRAAEVQAYEASYFPLRFVCRTAVGNSYSAAVPGYVNPAIAGFFAVTLITGAAANAPRLNLQRRNSSPEQADPQQEERA
ncbi:hypothetical protein [Streptomyces xylophagus]|uniref:hypothetical protein n=1 Tax=Streptomyces xylophagus TaxID=285514 RepID=UPI00131D3FE0|nr:hypothetical protein [Streptomyces xylophagus]